ncbi:hypothetical protein LCD36_04440 [Saccharopolyspora sp. 6T]|uniref:hypothetical protein n=1 Tax=Saccharopolyspora sp. 6T TaxID=2877238 RepID=UPI001CD7F6D6|nr:hypothetical protein [Saccharopolyspora sp. 6T]MCA1185700.1 hypothetical protein [Saccharopolyspora sp. 6T]
MAVISHVGFESVASSTHQNGLIDQVNTNTSTIATVDNTVSGHTTSINSLSTRMGTAESSITSLQGQARAGAYSGDWTDNNALSGGVTITNAGSSSAGNAGVKAADLGVAVGTATGCSMSSGTFTPTIAGKWEFFFGVQFVGGSSAMRAIYLAVSTAANTPSGVKYGLNAAVSDAISSGARIVLNANQSVSVYVACWTTSGSVQVWRAQGNLLSATWIGP